MATHFLLLVLAFAVLIGSAELLVRGASRLALRIGVSPFLVGLTVVGFGTSAPELAAAIASAREGYGGMAVGNVVGSNIMNVALVLGVTASVMPIPVSRRVVRREVIFTIAASFVPYLALLHGGVVGRLQGGLMVGGLVTFLAWTFRASRRESDGSTEPDGVSEKPAPGAGGAIAEAAMVVLGIGMLVVAASLLVDNATAIARAFGISEVVIGLTIVAGGTSAPELATSLVAVWRGQNDLGVGNILGSCVFNLLGILGITALLYPLEIPSEVLWFDLPVMIATALSCIPIMLTGHRIGRGEGIALATGFVIYTVLLFVGWPVPADRGGGGRDRTQDTAASIQPPPNTSSPS